MSIPPPTASNSTSRLLMLCLLAIGLGVIAGGVAQLLAHLIGFVTNLAFYRRFSIDVVSPKDSALGAWVIGVPVVGGLLVGLMARYGSPAIRGHGIPEAMEQVLLNQSRIPARLTWLKPVSAAIAIGTGGPFGAEGPIIATGGALGSLVGQLLHTTADERKILLCSGAAAGMAATFGTPMAAVLLAIELLLFEFRPRSILVVGLAAAAATGVRLAITGPVPAFAVPALPSITAPSLLGYTVMGVLLGCISVVVVVGVYAVEDAFEHLPIHWMYWPAIGGLAVGLIGYVAPRTLGVGYDNIEAAIAGDIAGQALAVLVVAKLVSWTISLGSGTSGGTLAPLLTVGAGAGSLLGSFAQALWPALGIDVRMAAMAGMAALFAGASRALLASVVFACEATGQLAALLPLMACCTAAYLVAMVLQRNSIMTEKLVRRGTHVPVEYVAEFFESVRAGDAASRDVVTFRATDTAADAQRFLLSHKPGADHQGYPVMDGQGNLVGVITRRDLAATELAATTPLQQLLRQPVLSVSSSDTLYRAMELMASHKLGRLPVVEDGRPAHLVGILTRSDILTAHARRLAQTTRRERTFRGKPPAGA